MDEILKVMLDECNASISNKNKGLKNAQRRHNYENYRIVTEGQEESENKNNNRRGTRIRSTVNLPIISQEKQKDRTEKKRFSLEKTEDNSSQPRVILHVRKQKTLEI